jgi:uncharacterized protein YndB with AHSA1/START domain
VDGRLEHRDGRWQLRFSRRLPHPPQKVWLALTEPEHLAAWFPADMEGERVAGAPLRFVFREGEAPAIDGEMLVCDPPSTLEFTWGEDVLRFEVRPDGEGSLLELVNTFDEQGKAARDAAGWHACLDLLANRLDGREPPWTPGERWQAVHPGYVERFGPEAATIGPPAPVDEDA